MIKHEATVRTVYGLIIFIFFCFNATAQMEQANTIDIHKHSRVFTTAVYEERYNALIKEVRCPKCQNQNVADSNAQIAKDMRRKIYEQVESGKTEEEVLDYLTARYGNFVRYTPPLDAATFILWYGPWILAFAVVFFVFKRIYNQKLTNDKKKDTTHLEHDNFSQESSATLNKNVFRKDTVDLLQKWETGINKKD